MSYLSSSAAEYSVSYFVNSGMKEKYPDWAKSEEDNGINNEDVPRAT